MADETNRVYPKRHKTIGGYCSPCERHDDVVIMEDAMGLPLVDVHVVNTVDELNKGETASVIFLELDDSLNHSYVDIRNCIDSLKNRATISVLLLGEGEPITGNEVDMLLDLTNEEISDYMFHYVSIFVNMPGYYMTGKHQYKARSHGVEVFPNLHTYYQKKTEFSPFIPLYPFRGARRFLSAISGPKDECRTFWNLV